MAPIGKRMRTPSFAVRAGIVAGVASLLGMSFPVAGLSQTITAVVTDPLPQVFTSSCQSYGFALSLALLMPETHGVQTAAELRAFEREIFAYLGEVSGKGNEDSWPGWPKAIEHFSGGRMMLVDEWFLDYPSMLDRVRELTGPVVHEANAELEITMQKRQPIMLSVSRIGKRTFASGHIVTVIGAGEAPMSGRPLLVVNPSVRTQAGDRVMCSEYDTQTDRLHWKAMVSPVGDYGFDPAKRVIRCVRTRTAAKNPKCDGG